MSAKEPLDAQNQPREFVTALWQGIRNRLENEKHRVYEEIRHYPRPIPACDQHFNALLEERGRICRELDRLEDAVQESLTRGDARELVAAFLRSSSYFGGDAAREAAAWIPEFGVATPGTTYVLRPGGYAVIFSAAGEVAVVATPCGPALPGGGQEGAESPEDAAVRETREECGLDIVLGDRLGVADELVFAADEQTPYRKRCVFFVAAVAGQTGPGEPGHELLWLAPADAAAALLHASQRWAVAEACRRTGRQG